MPVYDDLMGSAGTAAAPGAGSVLEPVVDTSPQPLPDMTPDLFQQLWGGTAPSTVTSSISTSGGADRGPAMHAEDLGGTAPGDAGKVIRAARSMLGLPYVWGGTSAVNGVDCSGLIKLAFQAAGIDMPRISADQARTGRRVALNQLKPGDLVSWDNSSRNAGADHIALYIGGGKIIEAPHPGAKVRIRKLGLHEGAVGSRVL